MTEIAIEELAGRLGEIRDRRRADAAGVRRNARSAVRPAAGPHSGRAKRRCLQLMQLDPAQIEAAARHRAGSEVVAYCHSGSRSAIATQMLRALGYDARNYVGSWHEWSRHDDLAIEL